MPYLLDTNVISEIRKRKNCNPGVGAWLASAEPDELFVSVLTLGEIRRGIELRRLTDPVSARHLATWLHGLEANYADRLLPISSAIADRWGRLSPRQPLPVIDGLLAATAIEHGLTVVTRNVDHFVRSGANTLNPFS